MSVLRSRCGLPIVHTEPGALVLHAASLGEGRIAAALAAAVSRARPELPVVRTCTRVAAGAVEIGAWQTLPWPLDLPGLPGAWLDRVRPRAVWLCEAELWPAMLAACRRRAIPVAVVAAPARPGTLRLLRAWPGLGAGLRWLPVDDDAGGRLRAVLGRDASIDPHPTGDLKIAAPVAAAPWPDRPDRPILVAGSTHAPDEAAVLTAWRGVLETSAAPARPLLILAPRDPTRARSACAAAVRAGFRATTWGARHPGADVVVLDSLGILAGLYPHAQAAFIGGTVGEGGRPHAPGEALACGLPVVGGAGGVGPAWQHPRARAVPVYALAAALRDALAGGPEPMGAAAFAAADEVVARMGGMLDAPVPDERPLRPWLAPLGWLWSAAARARVRRARPRASVPVIAVGGLVAGGAGKTEVSAWLAAQLPGAWIVGRGHGRGATRGLPAVRVEAARHDGGRCGGWNPPPHDPGHDDASWLGDELAMLLARGFGVVSAPDRRAGARAAAEAGARFVVLDDGWTTPTLAHDLAVVCVDARRPTGGAPIPAGEGKAPPTLLARADAVVCLHGPMPHALRRWLRPDAVVAEARYVPSGWLHDGQALPLPALPPRDVDVLVGIAHPGGVLRALRLLGFRPRAVRRCVDHHRFGADDLAWVAGDGRDDAARPVVTTVKDLVRLPIGTSAWALRVDLAFDTGEAALRACVARVGAAAEAPRR